VQLIWTSLLAAGATSALLLCAAAFRKWPVVGVAAIALNIITAWEVPQAPPLLSIVGTSIYPVDVLSVLFFVVAVLDGKRLSQNLGALRWLWAGFGLSILFSLLSGVIQIEVGSAVNEFRAFLYPFAAISWVLSLDWGRLRKLLTHLPVVLGWSLVAVAAFHAARFGLGGEGEFVDARSGIEQTTRPLVSGQALILLFCIPLTLRTWAQTSRRLPLISAAAFGVVVMIVQQRTVWAVAAAMIATFYLSSRGEHRTKGILAGIAVLWGGLILITSNVAGDLIGKLISAANDSSTYDARVNSWQNLIAESFAKGLGTVLFGAPFGTGYGRFEGVGRWVEFAPHNWYVTLFLRVGLVGTAIFALLLLAAIIRVIRSQNDATSVGILVGTLVYCWAYSIMWYSAIFVGWALIHSKFNGLQNGPADVLRSSRSSIDKPYVTGTLRLRLRLSNHG
jgi:hypothetical protein